MKHIRFIAIIVACGLILVAAIGLVVVSSTSGLAAPVGENANDEADKIGSVLLEKFQTEGQGVSI